MGFIEGLGSAIGSITGSLRGVGEGAGGVGAGVGSGGGFSVGIGGGIEAGGFMTGTASVSGPSVMPTFEAAPAVAGLETSFGPVMGSADLGPIINEGPFKGSLTDFNPIRPVVPDLGVINVPLDQFNVVSEAEAVAAQAWNPSAKSVVAEAEEIFFQTQKPKINDKIVDFGAKLWAFPQVEPMVMPFPAPKILEFPKAVSFPAVEPAVQTEPQPGSGVVNEVAPATMTQPALEEQALIEETVTERDTEKQIDTVREEIEEFKLKVVVDEEVLENRVVGLTGAAEVVAAKNEGGEIEGNNIVALTPPESEKERSGLIKKQGPDGSWIETLEELSSRKFRSLTEARKQIVEIITRKVPVKRGKEGKEADSGAVARVLKYFFVKYQPAEQLIKRITKKQKISVKEGQKSSLVETSKPQAKGSKIEDFPSLSEAFPKAA